MTESAHGIDTLIPFLFNGRKFTRHTFTRRERAAYLNSDGEMKGLGTALIYTCSETGVERRWGFEHAPIASVMS